MRSGTEQVRQVPGIKLINPRYPIRRPIFGVQSCSAMSGNVNTCQKPADHSCHSCHSLVVAGAMSVTAVLVHKWFSRKASWSEWCPFATAAAASKAAATPAPTTCPRHRECASDAPAAVGPKALTLSPSPAAGAAAAPPTPSAFSIGCPAGFGATPKHGVPAQLVRPKRGDKPVYYHDYLGSSR
jgi:hypothetical protein